MRQSWKKSWRDVLKDGEDRSAKNALGNQLGAREPQQEGVDRFGFGTEARAEDARVGTSAHKKLSRQEKRVQGEAPVGALCHAHIDQPGQTFQLFQRVASHMPRRHVVPREQLGPGRHVDYDRACRMQMKLAGPQKLNFLPDMLNDIEQEDRIIAVLKLQVLLENVIVVKVSFGRDILLQRSQVKIETVHSDAIFSFDLSLQHPIATTDLAA